MRATDMGAMEERLGTFGARIDDVLAKTRHSELATALTDELGVWREWIDEARVQAALGAMEGHDRVQEALKRLEHLYSSMRGHLALVKDATDPLPGLEETIRRELRSAKEVLSTPAAFSASEG